MVFFNEAGELLPYLGRHRQGLDDVGAGLGQRLDLGRIGRCEKQHHPWLQIGMPKGNPEAGFLRMQVLPIHRGVRSEEFDFDRAGIVADKIGRLFKYRPRRGSRRADEQGDWRPAVVDPRVLQCPSLDDNSDFGRFSYQELPPSLLRAFTGRRPAVAGLR